MAEQIVVGPGRITITHSHAAFTVKQTWVASIEDPVLAVLLDIETARPLRLSLPLWLRTDGWCARADGDGSPFPARSAPGSRLRANVAGARPRSAAVIARSMNRRRSHRRFNRRPRDRR